MTDDTLGSAVERSGEPGDGGADGSAVLCFGEAIADLFAVGGADELRDPIAAAERFEPRVGGSPCNVALALGRLGIPVALLGLVGDDGFGRMLRGELERGGVDTSLLGTCPARTPLAFVGRDAAGEPSFLFYRTETAETQLAPAHVDACAERVRRAALIHLCSSTLCVEPAASATWRLLELAEAAEVAVMLDVNLRTHLWSRPEEAAEATRRLAGHATVLKASAAEARALCDGERDRAAQLDALRGLGPSLVVVTDGARGADYAHEGGAAGHVAAPEVDAIDTTGAGDAFCAGLIAALRAHGMPRPPRRARFAGDVVRAAVSRGCEAASQRCTVLGAS